MNQRVLSSHSSCIAVFPTHLEADGAVKLLQKAGFDMTKLSILARDFNAKEHVVGFYNAGDRMAYWGTQGALWGGLWGLLLGSAFFWIPGMGPLVVAGPMVTSIVAALEGAVVVGSMSVVGAGLFSLGIPSDSIVEYETAIAAGKYVLVANGTAAETEKARASLNGSGAEVSRQHAHQRNGFAPRASSLENPVIRL